MGRLVVGGKLWEAYGAVEMI